MHDRINLCIVYRMILIVYSIVQGVFQNQKPVKLGTLSQQGGGGHCIFCLCYSCPMRSEALNYYFRILNYIFAKLYCTLLKSSCTLYTNLSYCASLEKTVFLWDTLQYEISDYIAAAEERAGKLSRNTEDKRPKNNVPQKTRRKNNPQCLWLIANLSQSKIIFAELQSTKPCDFINASNLSGELNSA